MAWRCYSPVPILTTTCIQFFAVNNIFLGGSVKKMPPVIALKGIYNILQQAMDNYLKKFLYLYLTLKSRVAHLTGDKYLKTAIFSFTISCGTEKPA